MFITHEDGYYALTNAGYIACALLMLAAILAVAFLSTKKKSGQTAKNLRLFQAKPLVFSSVALALAFVLSYVQPYKLPWGGSVTLFSTLFITLVGYWYGLKAGLTAAFAYSILQFIQGGGGYILTPFQVCCDYFFAFTALGFSGLFHEKKNGLVKGYLLGIFLRGLFHTIGGYIYWMEYTPENFPQSLAVVYPIVYNYSYILIEGVVTVLVLMLPPVKNALGQVKKMAVE